MIQDDAMALLKLGENVFLTGAAGAGKTWLLNRYIGYLRAHGVGVAVTASTGIAATHLDGRTLHSWSGIGVRDELSDAELAKLLRNKRLRRNYLDAKVLVIDEISMLHPHQLDMVDRIARGMLESDEPFGGLQVVACGDFFQLPPISPRGAPAAGGFAFHARAWHAGRFRIAYLHEQHRQGDDPLLPVLTDIRGGNTGEHTRVPLRTRYKREPEGDVRPTRLYARNINVDAINDRELARIGGEEKVFTMETRGPAALVDGLVKSCLAPPALRLKTGAQVMFVKNATDGAYVNGTRGVVEGFEKETGWPVVKTFDGATIIAAPADWKLEENGRVRATVIQVPLRLAWALTIHKSQGMTLDAAEIDLSDAFEPGMGYVALSRVRRLDGLKLMGLNAVALQVNAEVAAQDETFRRQSAEAGAWLQAFAERDRQRYQHEVLVNRFEGSAGPRDRKPRGDKKKPTHQVTRAMVEEKLTVEEIARRRELTPGTVLGHLEKLKRQDALPDIDNLKPAMPEAEFERLVRAFRDSGDGRLGPVHEQFGGRYSFEALRVVRLFAG
jgi:hypothetical protein